MHDSLQAANYLPTIKTRRYHHTEPTIPANLRTTNVSTQAVLALVRTVRRRRPSGELPTDGRLYSCCNDVHSLHYSTSLQLGQMRSRSRLWGLLHPHHAAVSHPQVRFGDRTLDVTTTHQLMLTFNRGKNRFTGLSSAFSVPLLTDDKCSRSS